MALSLLGTGSSPAETFALPPKGSDLIGEVRYTKSRQEDTLIDIARAFSVGQDEMVMANPTVDRWMPGEGTKVVVPRLFILPDAPRAGVVVNIPEMRLFYYPAKFASKVVSVPASGKGKTKTPASTKTVNVAGPATEVITYPVSIGRIDWRTPIGATRVVQKVKDPVWIPPETIKREHAADGDILPDVVPAGPNNPLGQFAMKLGVPGYLIHGTDAAKAYGIGMRVTHGCIRMYPEDIAKLFPVVSEGTPVYLVNQPIKFGWVGETLYMEVQQPLDEDAMSTEQMLRDARAQVAKLASTHSFVLDESAFREAVEKPTGIPVVISKNSSSIQAVPGTETLPEAVPTRDLEYRTPETVPKPLPAPVYKTPATPSEPVYPPPRPAAPAAPVYPNEPRVVPDSDAGQTYPPPAAAPTYPESPATTPAYPEDTAPSYPPEPVPAPEMPAGPSGNDDYGSAPSGGSEPYSTNPEGMAAPYPDQVEPAPEYPAEPAPSEGGGPSYPSPQWQEEPVNPPPADSGADSAPRYPF